MNNKVIQSLWVGNKLSNNELLCLRSYVRHGHTFHLYAYNELQALPDGVELKDANDIIPAGYIFRDSHHTYASFADWFRMKLLYSRGGWWVDMDTVCMRAFDVQDEYCFSSEWAYSMETKEVNNTCIKSPAGAGYLKDILQMVEEKVYGDELIGWGEIGVYLFRHVFPRYDHLLPYMKGPEVFCPVNYFDLSGLICAHEYRQHPDTLAIHLWNEVWRRGNLNKDACYHPDSIYERLKQQYLT